MAYRFDGKQKTLAFGSYPVATLADAREKRDNAKRLLADGVDPSQQAKLEKIRHKVSSASTLNAVAVEFLAKEEREGKAEATLIKKRWLLGFARRHFDNRPITEITALEILTPLREVESEGNHETARRLRATIDQVFRYAISTARADYDPTFGLRGR